MRINGIGRHSLLLEDLGADSARTHEPRDPVFAHRLALSLKRLVNDPELSHQSTILHRPAALRPSGPCIIARRRDRQGPAHHDHLEATGMGTNRPAPHGDGLAKYAATLFKKSRSCVTRARSRFSRTSSSCRAARRMAQHRRSAVEPHGLSSLCRNSSGYGRGFLRRGRKRKLLRSGGRSRRMPSV